jgi:uncharacterized protein YunC (DUF1805 family)
MNGKAQISVKADFSSGTTARLQSELNAMAKKMVLRVGKIKIDNQQFNKSIQDGMKKAQQVVVQNEKSTVKSIKNMDTANKKFFQSFQNLSNKTAKESASVFQEKFREMGTVISKTSINKAITDISKLSKKTAKESANVFQEHFKKIGTVIGNTSINKAIDNIGILSQKNAKQSASVFQRSFKETELNARKMQTALNNLLMPKLSGKSAQASASAFTPMLNNMASNDNKAFNSWFIPKATTDNINSAKASMSAFTSEVSKGATVYDRYGNVNRAVTQQFREQNREMINATRNQFAFGNMLMQGVKKMLVWSATAFLLYSPIRAFQRGLQTLKEIDTELVNIAKVTNLTKVEMQDLAMKATDVGIAFGRTTQEYLQAVTEFSRGGYGRAAEELAKVTMLLQNVGDVNAETANSFLLATDAAYKLGGSQEKLTDIVSGLNNVSNRNSTTVSKVAEGMSVSASLANQAGVAVEELSGAISTMTIVSQRSGSEATFTSLYGDI